MSGEQLTQEQQDRLLAELAELEGPARKSAVEAIATAREFGDLSENFEYHAAKSEQGLLERRISLLRDHLQGAEIVETSTESVSSGAHVTIEDEQGERLEVEISNAGGAGTVSTASPLGEALYGKSVGDSVEIKAPRSTWTATIIAIA